MYVICNDIKYYISRVYWFNSGDCAIYEFINLNDEVIDFEVKPNEKLTDKVEVYYEQKVRNKNV